MKKIFKKIFLNRYIIVGFIAFAASLIFIGRTVLPYVPPCDSPILALAGATLGIPHPSGYPLYVILANIASRVIPCGNIIYRINLMSGFFASVTAGLIAMIVLQLGGSFISAFFGAFIWMVMPLTIYYGRIAEVFTLHTSIAAALLLFFLMWWKKPDRRALLLLVAFLGGLGMTNHYTISLFAICIIAGILLRDSKVFKNPGLLARLTICALLPVLMGACIIFILALRQPALNWGDPSTLSRLWSVLSRKEFGTFSLNRSYEQGWKWSSFWWHFKHYLLLIGKNISLYGALLVLAGFFCLFRKDRKVSLFFLVCLLCTGALFVTLYSGMPTNKGIAFVVERFFLANMLVLSIIAAFGVDLFVYITGKLYTSFREKKLLKYQTLHLVFITIGAALIFSFLLNSLLNIPGYLRWKPDMYFHYYLENVLTTLEPDSLFISKNNSLVFGIWYVQQVEGRRKDVLAVFPTLDRLERQRQMKNIDTSLSGSVPEIMRRFAFKDFSESEYSQFIKEILMRSVSERPVFYTCKDFDYPHLNNFAYPKGLLMKLLSVPALSSIDAQELGSLADSIWSRYSLTIREEPSEDAPDLMHRLARDYLISHMALARDAFKRGADQLAKRAYVNASRLSSYAPEVIEAMKLAKEFQAKILRAEGDPEDIDKQEAALKIALKLGRYMDAGRLYRRIAQISTVDSAFYQKAGLALIAIGDFEGSRYFLKKAISLDPDILRNSDIRRLFYLYDHIPKSSRP